MLWKYLLKQEKKQGLYSLLTKRCSTEGTEKVPFFRTLIYPYSWKYGIIVRVLKELYE